MIVQHKSGRKKDTGEKMVDLRIENDGLKKEFESDEFIISQLLQMNEADTFESGMIRRMLSLLGRYHVAIQKYGKKMAGIIWSRGSEQKKM